MFGDLQQDSGNFYYASLQLNRMILLYVITDLPSLSFFTVGLNAFYATPSVSISNTPSLTSIVLSETGGITGFGSFLMKLVQSPTSYPAVRNITSITIPSDSYNEPFSVLNLGWFPDVQSVSIGDGCFQNVSQLIFMNNTELTSITIGDSSFLFTTSVVLSGIPHLSRFNLGEMAFFSAQSLTLLDTPFTDGQFTPAASMPFWNVDETEIVSDMGRCVDEVPTRFFIFEKLSLLQCL